MKTYDEMKKETDAMPDGPQKKVLKSLLSQMKRAENLQKKYEKMKDKMPEDETLEEDITDTQKILDKYIDIYEDVTGPTV